MAKEETKQNEMEETKPEEQLKEMEEIIEKEEMIKDKIISKEVEEQFRREEGRNLTPDEKRRARFDKEAREKLESWIPLTELGKEVQRGKIKNIDEILSGCRKIMEPEIVDILIPGLIADNLFIGQSKGKFGGGKRRAFRQTQKKTKEGNVLTFGVMAVVGDGRGHVGIGYGRASETLPAKEKAVRKAKLNIMKIRRGCGSYDCSCDEPHSIPLNTIGKCSSVSVKLMPAPQGTGLVIGDEMKKILRAAGIKDIYSKCFGKVKTTFNTAKACMLALNKLGSLKL